MIIHFLQNVEAIYKNINKNYRKMVGPLVYRLRVTLNAPQLQVKSIEDTINTIISNSSSVIRYGDGEIAMIEGRRLKFQAYEQELAQSLVQYARCDDPNLLVCIPDVFNGLSDYTDHSQSFWQANLLDAWKTWYRFFDPKRTYYNAFMSRPYISYRDKSQMESRFLQISELWAKKDVLLIEGEATRNGVISGLLDAANSVTRILCPSKHAFSSVEKIVSEAHQLADGKITLVTLGPAAKVIVYKLHQLGHQTIDFGQLDSEYRYYLMGSDHKTLISDDMILQRRQMADHKDSLEARYQTQIITRIDDTPSIATK